MRFIYANSTVMSMMIALLLPIEAWSGGDFSDNGPIVHTVKTQLFSLKCHNEFVHFKIIFEINEHEDFSYFAQALDSYFMNESDNLRKFSAGASLPRECTEANPYQLKQIVIEKFLKILYLKTAKSEYAKGVLPIVKNIWSYMYPSLYPRKAENPELWARVYLEHLSVTATSRAEDNIGINP